LDKSPRRYITTEPANSQGRKRSRVASSYRMTVRRRNTVDTRSFRIEIHAMASTSAGWTA
jgi:hypothetical protein